MRRLLILSAVFVVSLALHTTAQTQAPAQQAGQIVYKTPMASSPNKGVGGLNHLAFYVPNLDEAYEFYTKKMGFPEVLRRVLTDGSFNMFLAQMGPTAAPTFLEIIVATTQNPPGIAHVGIKVDDPAAANEMFKQRGASMSGNNVVDPSGIRLELVRGNQLQMGKPGAPLQQANGKILFQDVAPSPNQGVAGMNHVAISVPSLPQAHEYYTNVLGFPEVLRRATNDKDGYNMFLVRLSPTQNENLEIAVTSAERPAGLYHIGLQVADVAAAAAMFKARGANVLDAAPTAATRNVVDPFGNRIELVTGRAQQAPPQGQ